MVSIIKINACSVITRMWKIAQGTDNAHWIQNGNNAIKMKINSPAYMLPNSRRANETGRARKVTNSKTKFTGINNAFANLLLGLNHDDRSHRSPAYSLFEVSLYVHDSSNYSLDHSNRSCGMVLDGSLGKSVNQGCAFLC